MSTDSENRATFESLIAPEDIKFEPTEDEEDCNKGNIQEFSYTLNLSFNKSENGKKSSEIGAVTDNKLEYVRISSDNSIDTNSKTPWNLTRTILPNSLKRFLSGRGLGVYEKKLIKGETPYSRSKVEPQPSSGVCENTSLTDLSYTTFQKPLQEYTVESNNPVEEPTVEEPTVPHSQASHNSIKSNRKRKDKQVEFPMDCQMEEIENPSENFTNIDNVDNTFYTNDFEFESQIINHVEEKIKPKKAEKKMVENVLKDAKISNYFDQLINNVVCDRPNVLKEKLLDDLSQHVNSKSSSTDDNGLSIQEISKNKKKKRRDVDHVAVVDVAANNVSQISEKNVDRSKNINIDDPKGLKGKLLEDLSQHENSKNSSTDDNGVCTQEICKKKKKKRELMQDIDCAIEENDTSVDAAIGITKINKENIDQLMNVDINKTNVLKDKLLEDLSQHVNSEHSSDVNGRFQEISKKKKKKRKLKEDIDCVDEDNRCNTGDTSKVHEENILKDDLEFEYNSKLKKDKKHKKNGNTESPKCEDNSKMYDSVKTKNNDGNDIHFLEIPKGTEDYSNSNIKDQLFPKTIKKHKKSETLILSDSADDFVVIENDSKKNKKDRKRTKNRDSHEITNLVDEEHDVSKLRKQKKRDLQENIEDRNDPLCDSTDVEENYKPKVKKRKKKSDEESTITDLNKIPDEGYQLMNEKQDLKLKEGKKDKKNSLEGSKYPVDIKEQDKNIAKEDNNREKRQKKKSIENLIQLIASGKQDSVEPNRNSLSLVNNHSESLDATIERKTKKSKQIQSSVFDDVIDVISTEDEQFSESDSKKKKQRIRMSLSCDEIPDAPNDSEAVRSEDESEVLLFKKSRKNGKHKPERLSENNISVGIKKSDCFTEPEKKLETPSRDESSETRLKFSTPNSIIEVNETDNLTQSKKEKKKKLGTESKEMSLEGSPIKRKSKVSKSNIGDSEDSENSMQSKKKKEKLGSESKEMSSDASPIKKKFKLSMSKVGDNEESENSRQFEERKEKKLESKSKEISFEASPTKRQIESPQSNIRNNKKSPEKHKEKKIRSPIKEKERYSSRISEKSEDIFRGIFTKRENLSNSDQSTDCINVDNSIELMECDSTILKKSGMRSKFPAPDSLIEVNEETDSSTQSEKEKKKKLGAESAKISSQKRIPMATKSQLEYNEESDNSMQSKKKRVEKLGTASKKMSSEASPIKRKSKISKSKVGDSEESDDSRQFEKQREKKLETKSKERSFEASPTKRQIESLQSNIRDKTKSPEKHKAKNFQSPIKEKERVLNRIHDKTVYDESEDIFSGIFTKRENLSNSDQSLDYMNVDNSIEPMECDSTINKYVLEKSDIRSKERFNESFTFSDILSQSHNDRLKEKYNEIVAGSTSTSNSSDHENERKYVRDKMDSTSKSEDKQRKSDHKKQTRLDKFLIKPEEVQTIMKKQKAYELLLQDKTIQEIEEELEISHLEQESKIKDLEINIFAVPLLHRIAHLLGTNPTEQQKLELKSAGIELKAGRFTRREDEKLRKRWNQFCEEHDWNKNDYHIFLQGSTSSKKGKLSGRQFRKFVQYISYEFENRTMYIIYKRFKRLFSNRTKTLFTDQDDTIIEEYINSGKSHTPFADLATILNKDRSYLLKRYSLCRSYLKNHNERVSWNKELTETLLANLIEVTRSIDLSELKDRTISAKEWQKISDRMKIPVHKLKRSWTFTFYPRFFSPNYNAEIKDVKIKLIEMIDERYSDFDDIDWNELAEEFSDGFTSQTLMKIFNDLLFRTVPTNRRRDFRRSIKMLKKSLESLHCRETLRFLKDILKETNNGTICPKIARQDKDRNQIEDEDEEES